MMLEHQIGSVFKKVSSPPSGRLEPNWRLLYYNPKTKKTFTPSWWNRIRTPEVEYYIVKDVSGFTDAAQHPGLQLKLNDFPRDRLLSVVVRYQAYCIPHQESSFISQLQDRNNPGPSLDLLIVQWIRSVIAGREEYYINGFFQYQNDMQVRVEERAKDFGIALKVYINPEKFDHIQNTQKLTIDDHAVEVPGYPVPQRVSMNLSLQLIPERKIYALVENHRIPSLSDLIKQTVSRGVLERYKPYDFFSDYHSGKLKEYLQRLLLEALAERGWHVANWSLTFLEKRPVKKFDDTLTAVVTISLQFPKPIEVHNQAHAHLQDYARYRLVGAPDLQEWFAKTMDKTIKSVLIDKPYEEVLAGFDEIKEHIIRDMEVEAKEIGFTLKPLMSKTELGPEKLLVGFVLEQHQAEFQTNTMGVPASLGFYINGRLRKLGAVKHLLKLEVNEPGIIDKTMTDKVVERIRGYLLGLNPEKFYMEFEQAKQEHDRSVRENLHTIIQSTLEKFDATDLEIRILPGNTHITEKLMTLIAVHRRFTVNIFPHQGEYHIPIEGEFRVNGVNEGGWSDFLQRDFDLDAVGAQLCSHIAASFSQFTEAQLLDALKSLNKFQRNLCELTALHLRKFYGIEVEVFNIKKLPSYSEDLNIKIQKRKRDSLYDKRIELINLQGQKDNLDREAFLIAHREKLNNEAAHVELYDKKLKQLIDESEDFTREELDAKVFKGDRDSISPTYSELQTGLLDSDKQLADQVSQPPRDDLDTPELKMFPWDVLDDSAATLREEIARKQGNAHNSKNEKNDDENIYEGETL
ncbi:MAG: hypothetical protein HQL07_14670 [Nitrospirae bacterium]|nr:hypothetical protein [Magnetococcales bacterium]HAT51577.1 hypothetical protein [Alphaproteobacteria bacterium]